jgi:hypothetical protein
VPAFRSRVSPAAGVKELLMTPLHQVTSTSRLGAPEGGDLAQRPLGVDQRQHAGAHAQGLENARREKRSLS